MKKIIGISTIFFILIYLVYTNVYAEIPTVKYENEFNYPPFTYMENNQLHGFDIEFTNLIFNSKDYEVDYSPNTWDNVYAKIKAQEIDTCGLLGINEERKKDILFTNSVLKTQISIYAKNITNEISLEDLKKYKIGVGKGRYTEEVLRDTVGMKNYSAFEDLDTAVDALISGQIDILFENQEAINYLIIKRNLNGKISVKKSDLFPKEFAYGVSKSNPELLKYMNKRIAELQKSGAYEELYMKYFFIHSKYYNDAKVRKLTTIAVFVVVGILIIINIMRLYIKYLRKCVKEATSELSKQHEWLRVTLTSIGDAVIATDEKGVILFANRIAQKLTGVTEREFIGNPVDAVLNLINGDNESKITLPIQEIISKGNIFELPDNTMLKGKDNERFNISNSISPIKNAVDEIIGVVMVFQDITLKKLSEQRLNESYQELEALYEQIAASEEQLKNQYDELQISELALKNSEERYRLALEGCNDGIWDMEIEDMDVFCSKKCLEIIGLDQVEGKISINRWLNLIHLDDFNEIQRLFREHLDRKTSYFIGECRLKSANSSYKWVLIRGKAIWDDCGRAVRAAGSLSDITENKKAQEIAHKFAYYDSLTGLPNRALLYKRLEEELNKAKERKIGGALLFIDLDNFKSINDTLGHEVGDELLKRSSKILSEYSDEQCSIYRLGGDEFIVLFTNTKGMDQVISIAENIIHTFSIPVTINKIEFVISASIGIALYPEHADNIGTLLKNADIAMYSAKTSGKNGFKLYSPEMNTSMLERLDMEKSLRHAVNNEEFTVYYQPKIDINTGEIVGMEALIRWLHPKKGIISPMQFIPIAEESGLIVPIGEQVLRQACRQNVYWQSKGYKPIPVAVNISAKQFEHGNLIETIKNVLKETGLDTKWLEIEITESVAMSDFNFTTKVLRELQDLGVKVSLDDFGTGYSSLNYLKNLPINSLKIDKSFVNDLTPNSNEEAIAEAIISLAHKMKLDIIAEGVETNDQLQFLKSHGCDIVQGYLFSKPVSKEEFAELLEKF